jgi:hypothetical protein
VRWSRDKYYKIERMKITKYVALSGYVGGPTMAVIAKNVQKFKSQ